MRRVITITILVVVSACSSAKPPAVAPGINAAQRLADADRLVRAGCYDCLVAAYREYDALRSAPGYGPLATARAIRAAGLLALRERELGMLESGYLKIAADLVRSAPELAEWVSKALDVVEFLPVGTSGAGRRPSSDEDLARVLSFSRNQDSYRQMLHEFAAADELGAYAYSTLECNRPDGRGAPADEIFAAVALLADTPLMKFRRATCRSPNQLELDALFENNPRLLEATYFLGSIALGRQDLEGAEAAYKRAYEWHPKWPALTQSLANVAMTAEEFDDAIRYYDETLTMDPAAVQARLGKVRALTYATRHEDAIAETDVLLRTNWNLGETRYWRALNETQIRRYDEAWGDIEESAKLLINAQVPKLAGVIAYRRQQLDVSRGKFEESYTRNPNDCETGFYLGVVLAEQQQWTRTAEVLVGAAQCLEEAERRLLAEIEAVRASKDPPARQAKQIARRERDIANGRRMIATSWFNTAVSFYSLARNPEARQFAEKVVDDEQFGDRAKEILSRVK